MSDRIDELVAAIDANTLLQWDGKDVALEAAHELATIAREAERDAATLQSVVGDSVKAKTLRYLFHAYSDGELVESIEADKWRKAAEWLSHRLGAKSWMSLTGITRRAIGGDNEDTRDAFVRAEADSQLEAALAAVEKEEAE